MKIKQNLVLAGLAWLLLVGLALFWNHSQIKAHRESIMLQTARSFFQQITFTRQWNALHGGVFVPISPETQPNPYLPTEGRDIMIDGQLALTKVNPAFMTRQISEIARQQQGIQFHITSLTPLRPGNQASQTERAALEQFEQGLTEVGFLQPGEPDTTFFYMAPLVVNTSCLACHAHQGYKEGDVRGGISITLPIIESGCTGTALFFGHFTLALIGLMGIGLAGSQLNRAYTTIKRQAVLDALTGIPNRRSFSESILREFKRCRREHTPLSLIICDIDNFKAYNDTYGHTSGDLCLQKVARAIEASLDRPGDFCARYGGEEFVVILSDTHLEGAMAVAERIRQNVVDLAITHHKSVPLQRVSLSLGVATSMDTRRISHEDLIRFADKALYTAKANGKNRVEVFQDS